MARKILLADDSVTAQNMGRRILTDAGYEVVTVNNGSAALKRIAEHAPDLIVLDVYMPGYSGLEVCQRIKENRETARIPVLLTVGKLEPFKPEEARRVRADAYIVKPFEASELLTALTKLEDKIVPQPEPYKPGRFAKAIASAEGKGEGFGDSETGWKDRLVIPPQVHKLHEVAPPEAPVVSTSSLRDLARPEDFKPADLKKEFERPMPAGLPADITPEEIAAITAAAAKISGKAQPPAAEATLTEMAVVPEAVASAHVPAETVVAPEPVASAPAVADEPAEPAPATFASVSSDETAAAEVASAEVTSKPAEVAEKIETPIAAEVAAVESAAPEAVTAAAPETESQPSLEPEAVAEPAVAAETPVNHDAEVLAAVASLGAPTNGDGPSYASGSDQSSEPPANIAGAVAELAAVASFASGPRWVAEPMALAEDEATFLLEQEMEKAYAAAQSSHTVLAATAEVATATAVAEPPAIQPIEVIATTEIAPAAQESREVSTESKSEPATEDIPAPEPTVTDAVAAIPEPSPANSQAGEPAASTETELSPATPETAAYAAAAAAGSASTESTIADAISQTTTPAPVADVVDRQSEVELAAAWANWHQVRDSILGSQIAVQIADAEAGYKQSEQSAPPAEPPVQHEAQPEVHPESKAAEAEPQVAAETAAEASDVSSIVDNMLAELKPKLMEELTRKLAKEKKKK